MAMQWGNLNTGTGGGGSINDCNDVINCLAANCYIQTTACVDVCIDSIVRYDSGNGKQAIDSYLAINDSGAIQSKCEPNAAGATWPTISVDLQVARISNTQIASGNYSVLTGGRNNTASGNYSVIPGGHSNNASGIYSYIGSGYSNDNSGSYSVISGGYSNSITATQSVISGGSTNSISGNNSVITGGLANTIEGRESFIAAGDNNQIIGSTTSACAIIAGDHNTVTNDAELSVIVTGDENTIDNCTSATILGGNVNTIQSSSQYATILGGIQNTITSSSALIGVANQSDITSSSYGSIVSGNQNTLDSAYASTIVSGENNTILNSSSAFIGAGNNNNIETAGHSSAIIAGIYNDISQPFSFIGTGTNNNVTSAYSSITSGRYNDVNDTYSGIVSGNANNIQPGARYSFIGSGTENVISGGYHTVIAGGSSNIVTENNSAILGGRYNEVRGEDSSIVGGYNNSISSTTTDPQYCFVGGGIDNRVLGASYSGILFGNSNTISNPTMGDNAHNIISSGFNNTMGYCNKSAIYSGDNNNLSYGSYLSVLSGNNNIIARSNRSTIISGNTCSISDCNYSTIINGNTNRITGNNSVISNGITCTIDSDRSYMFSAYPGTALNSENTAFWGVDHFHISDSPILLEETARFQVDSTDKGILVPRMSETQRDAIIDPANSLLIFNTDSNCYNYWDDIRDRWMCMCITSHYYEKSVTFADITSPITLLTLHEDSTIKDIHIVVDEEFDNATQHPILTVGTDSDNDKFAKDYESDLESEGSYKINSMYKNLGPTDETVKLWLSSYSASIGSVRVIFEIIDPIIL